ncbi:hypothetical protein J2T58_001853 [Methanocalculus alkaliphilus]|nr:hypothetical protein [Methanocalculus alkaliphilus]
MKYNGNHIASRLWVAADEMHTHSRLDLRLE